VNHWTYKLPNTANSRNIEAFENVTPFRIRNYFVSLLSALLIACNAQAEPVHQCAPDGIAVGGYDLVSYHQGTAPRQGLPQYAADHGGLSYHFMNPGNRDQFQAAPEKYLPVYRGFCATTLAMGALACPDYSNFKLENGRLLLFELAGFTNGRTVWNSDPTGFRQRADVNYIKLVP
jgi:hypothetical protein